MFWPPVAQPFNQLAPKSIGIQIHWIFTFCFCRKQVEVTREKFVFVAGFEPVVETNDTSTAIFGTQTFLASAPKGGGLINFVDYGFGAAD